jgi:hypothetical protein
MYSESQALELMGVLVALLEGVAKACHVIGLVEQFAS